MSKGCYVDVILVHVRIRAAAAAFFSLQIRNSLRQNKAQVHACSWIELNRKHRAAITPQISE